MRVGVLPNRRGNPPPTATRSEVMGSRVPLGSPAAPRWRLLPAAIGCVATLGLGVALAPCSSPSAAAAWSDFSQTMRLATIAAATRTEHASRASTPGSRRSATARTRSRWTPKGAGLGPAVPPVATPDLALDELMSNQLGPGWIGGDSMYSTRLPDGRIAFVFSDTLIGVAQPDGAASMTGMARSSELVGVLPNLSEDYSGTFRHPTSLIPDTYTTGDEWETYDTYTQGSNQMIFVNEYSGQTGNLTESFTGRSGIAVMSLQPSGLPTLSSVVLLPTDSATEWGQAIARSGAYMYVYGAVLNRAHQGVHDMRIARVPAIDSLDVADWRYWNGSKWISGEKHAAVVSTVNELTGVVKNPDGRGFIAVSIPSGLFADRTVDLSYAKAPEGPWSKPKAVFNIPEVGNHSGEFAYIPTFHPELSSGDDVLVVSYNINNTGLFPVLLHDIHTYQPRFLDIRG
jgi:hypothetical protein